MDFALTKEQELLRTSVREFSEKIVAPKVEQMEQTGEFPKDLLGDMAKLGLMGVTQPREFGGAGLGHVARMIMVEEVSRVSAAVGFTVMMMQTGSSTIFQAGSDDQKQRYLPGLARGQKYASMTITEASGGSDPGSIQTTAKLDGDAYVINGRKCFITNSHMADLYCITARTGEGPRGVSAFIVDRTTPGCRPGRLEHKFGMHGCETGEVIFENCRVPKQNLIGAEGQGVRIALGTISDYGRPGTAAVAVGILSACLDAAVKFSKERVLYGKPIAELQGIQWLISEMYLDLEISRLLTYRAAWMRDSGMRADAEISAAKYYATEAAARSAKKALDIHGGYGSMNEFPVQRYYRDVELLIPAAGTSEVQKLIMARKPLA